jgi:hypothetical protein
MKTKLTRRQIDRAEHLATEMLDRDGVPANAEHGLALIALGVVGVLNGGVRRSTLAGMLGQIAAEVGRMYHGLRWARRGCTPWARAHP